MMQYMDGDNNIDTNEAILEKMKSLDLSMEEAANDFTESLLALKSGYLMNNDGRIDMRLSLGYGFSCRG